MNILGEYKDKKIKILLKIYTVFNFKIYNKIYISFPLYIYQTTINIGIQQNILKMVDILISSGNNILTALSSKSVSTGRHINQYI